VCAPVPNPIEDKIPKPTHQITKRTRSSTSENNALCGLKKIDKATENKEELTINKIK
jgi:hypothetical protein